MIKGIGCDIVDLNRLNDCLDEFACKILTFKEFEIYRNKKTDKQTISIPQSIPISTKSCIEYPPLPSL